MVRSDRHRLQRAAAVLAGVMALTAALFVVSGRGAVVASNVHVIASPAHVQTLLGGIPQHDLTLGNPDAPVTVTEFADLMCPDCANYAQLLFPELVNDYVKTGKVKMVFRSLAFVSPGSVVAAGAAAAAGRQNRLWSFVDAFYYYGGGDEKMYVSDAFLRRVAAAVPGLRIDRVMHDRLSPGAFAQLRIAAALGRAEEVTGTPTFVIVRSGYPLLKILGFARLKHSIDLALTA